MIKTHKATTLINSKQNMPKIIGILLNSIEYLIKTNFRLPEVYDRIPYEIYRYVLVL